jgi:branched-chain amino acid transport system ATP-binding protein
MQRRLEVARALASDPELLLLDEPTAGMNPNETVSMMALIRRLRDELGLTILLIEHDMKLVMGISERVTVLNYGKKIAEGSPQEVQANEEVVTAYLGRRHTTGGTPVPDAAARMEPPEAQPSVAVGDMSPVSRDDTQAQGETTAAAPAE